ncbi:MAG: hypothetical protein H8D45_23700 [Bacteroidetes bacterium]|nr:hypothetical protein [Bacteroidota bacterium]MBL7105910.1 threonyl-tRNA synthetase editing domain-containing protein [Bacteroidales bacterium]
MKLLMIYTRKFAYQPTIKVLADAEDAVSGSTFENVQVAFIHAEIEDEERLKAVETKLVKNLKWVCGKNKTKHIILHSFAHLSESKANPDFTKDLFDSTQKRLENTGYKVNQTPFGYFLDLKMDAPGLSLARVFKVF